MALATPHWRLQVPSVSLDPASDSRRAKYFSRPRRPVRNGRQAHGRQQPLPQRQESGAPFTFSQDGAPSVLRERQVSLSGVEASSPTRHGGTTPGGRRATGRASSMQGRSFSLSSPTQPQRRPPGTTSGMDASILYRHSSGSGDNTGQCRRRNVRSTGRCIS